MTALPRSLPVRLCGGPCAPRVPTTRDRLEDALLVRRLSLDKCRLLPSHRKLLVSPLRVSLTTRHTSSPQWERAPTSPMPRPPSSPSPPPAPFPLSFTTGSFDFPHASTSPPTVSRSASTSASRNALHSLAEPTPSAYDATSSPRDPARRVRTRTSTRRGPLHRLFGPPRDSDAADNLARRPPTANPNRPRAVPSESYLRRSQARTREQRLADMDATNDVLDSLSDLPTSNPFTISNTQPRSRSPIVQLNSERRHKRRKLEHDSSAATEYMCFKYGHRGQVVPGRLRMEIISCDGGEHRRDNPPGLYRVQNVLRNDKSVYCSESSQCNLLLKHIGEAPFALEKIVIRAPDRGFTAPYVSPLRL